METAEVQKLLGQLEFYKKSSQLRERTWDALEEQIEVAAREKQACACFLFDIDHFCSIVSATGHDEGGKILMACLARLQETSSSQQAMSYGRDEFMVTTLIKGTEEAMFLAERLRRNLAETVSQMAAAAGAAQSQPTGCSAGIAIYPLHAAEAMALLGKAEEGLYLAKRQGRNLTKLPSFESMTLKSNYYSRVQLERLSALASRLGQSEASLLREALDRLLSDCDT